MSKLVAPHGGVGTRLLLSEDDTLAVEKELALGLPKVAMLLREGRLA